MGMLTIVPLSILTYPMSVLHRLSRGNKKHPLDTFMRLTAHIYDGHGQRDDFIMHGDTGQARDGRMHAQSFLDDHVEVRQGVERVHVRRVRVYCKQLLAQLALHRRGLCEREETPGRPIARGLVPSDEETMLRIISD